VKRPSPLLVTGLAATLMAAYLAPAPQGDEVALSERARAPATATAPSPPGAPAPRAASPGPAPPAAAVEVLRIRPREVAEATEAATWFPAPPRPAPVLRAPPPPPPASAAAPPPPPPQAPPLPFKALGRYADGSQAGVFLQYRDQNIVARVGDTLAEQYKVESLVGGVLTLRYLPLDQTQTLEVGTN
jgi:hypothetical protein